MRITAAEDYEEPRDSLAQDWARFMSIALPEVAWTAIPNTGESAVQFVESWGLEALILTGGDDIGQTPLRDETERALLDHFVARRMPVFGVCRGMQLIQSAYGGRLSSCKHEDHVATRHTVNFVDESGSPDSGKTQTSVNSFHTTSIDQGGIADGLSPLGLTDDGYVEAFHAPDIPLAAVMWHPERESTPSEFDCRLLRRLFGYSTEWPDSDD